MPPKKKKNTPKAKAAAANEEEEQEEKKKSKEPTPEVKLELAVAIHEHQNSNNQQKNEENDSDLHQPSTTFADVKAVTETNLHFLDMTKFAQEQESFEAQLVVRKRQEKLHKLAFSQDGEFIAAGSGLNQDDPAQKKVFVYDGRTLELVKTLDTSNYVASFSYDSKFLVAFSGDSPLRLCLHSTAEDFKKVSEIELGGRAFNYVKASHFKPKEVLVLIDEIVRLVNISTKKIIWSVEFANFVFAASFLTSDKVVASYGNAGKFAVIQKGKVVKQMQHGNSTWIRFAVFANSPRFVTLDQKTLEFWNSQTFEMVSSVDLSEEKPWDVRLVPPNDCALVLSTESNARPGALLFLDSETGEKRVSHVRGGGADRGPLEIRRGSWLDVDPSGSYLALNNGGENILLFSLNLPAPRLGRPFMPTQTFKTPITHLEFAQDGMSVVATDVQNKKRNIELEFGNKNQHLVQAAKEALERKEKLRLRAELEQERRLREETRKQREERERENEELKRQIARERASAASATSASAGGLTAQRRERENDKQEEEEEEEEKSKKKK